MQKIISFLFFVVLFNAVSSDPDPNIYCRTIVQRFNNKDLYADPNDCHGYFQCFYYNGTYAIGIKRQCPPTTFWHDSYLQCVPENPAQPCHDPCRDETFASLGCYASDGDCSTFFTCSNEISYKFCCPPLTRFNSDICSCIEDVTCKGNCSMATVATTTLPPQTNEVVVINETFCRDISGNYLRKIDGNPAVFELVDLDHPENTRLQSCAPGTSFAIQSCACDVTIQPPRTNPRQCALYLPFDGDIIDDSTMQASGLLVGNAEINYVHKARGSASLKLFGGWMELPTFKNIDLQTTASWCFFYRCGLDPTNHSMPCSESAGLLSNNVDANMTSFSIVVASVPTDRLEVQVGFKNPFSTTLLDADFAPLVDGPNDFHQVCVVQEEAMTNLYVNNQLVSTMGTAKLLATSQAPLTIGSDQKYGNFYGYIDEFLFCNFGITSEEVTAHYRGADTLVEAGLIPENNRRSVRSVPIYGDVDTEWPKWCEKFKRDPADSAAKIAFAETLEHVKEHNAMYKDGKVLHPMVLTKFAAQTESQTVERNFGLMLPSNYHDLVLSASKQLKALNCDKLPAYFDWVDKGVVSTPRDQGSCGCCWAIVAAGAVEGQLGIHKNLKGIQLSVQQLVDCSKGFKTKGCRGGLMSMAYQYLSSSPGLHKEAKYPYEETDKPKCRTNTSIPMYGQLFNYRETVGDECNLAFDLMNSGPLSIGMEILDDFMNMPTGTIYSTKRCKKPVAALNHALLLVGFGTDPDTGVKYWRIKNSWGPNWGEGGFVRVLRDDKSNPNICGIANLVSSPVLLGATNTKTTNISVLHFGAKDEIVQAAYHN